MKDAKHARLQSRKRYVLIPRTLSFISNNEHILLIKNSPTKENWPDLYNGIGGHVERGENIQQAALRELREETGLQSIDDLRLRGTITIDTTQTQGIMVFVFTGTTTSRRVIPSTEGILQWVHVKDLTKLPCVNDVIDLVQRITQMDIQTPPFHLHYGRIGSPPAG